MPKANMDLGIFQDKNPPTASTPVGEFCFLKYFQVRIGLGHLSQRQRQTSVSAVMNVVGAKPNRHPPPRISPSTPEHPLPTYDFFPSLLRYLPRSLWPPLSSVPDPVPPTPVGPFYSSTHYRPCSILYSLLRAIHFGMGFSVAP